MIKILKGIISIIKYVVILCVLITVAIIVVQKFSNNNMSVAGYRLFTVITESMVPKYNIGDVLLVKYTEPSEIKRQDDVTYMGKVGSFADKIVTHQVIDIKQNDNGKLSFVTKGIANEEKDPIVEEEQIYGTVKKKLNIITKLNEIINNTYGMYFLIVIPLAIMIFTEIRGFKEDMEERKKEIEGTNDEENDDEVDKRAQRRKQRRNKRRKRHG